MIKRHRLCFLALAILALVGPAASAQDVKAETSSEVPELTAFHDIIYPIWHTAYPSKDCAALRGFVPQVNELAAKVFAAQLPGILRDKKAKWEEGLAVFKKSVEAYNEAAKGQNDQAMLDAAEALHAKYEALVRLISPVLAEVEAFHQILYVLYHKDYPAKAFDKIRGTTAELVAKAEAIAKATLSKRLEAKTEAFRKAAADLLEAAKSLDTAGQNHDHEGMLKGVEVLHVKYQALEAVFN